MAASETTTTTMPFHAVSQSLFLGGKTRDSPRHSPTLRITAGTDRKGLEKSKVCRSLFMNAWPGPFVVMGILPTLKTSQACFSLSYFSSLEQDFCDERDAFLGASRPLGGLSNNLFD